VPSALLYLRATLFALLALVAMGCQATARSNLSAQASLQATGASSAQAGSSMQASGSATLTVRGPTIRLVHDRNQDRLEYEGTIHFAYDEARLEGDETFRVLREFQEFLQKNTRVNVRIEGHTDSRGSEAHNKQLSQRRAEAIRRWLAQHGVEASRLEAVGRGEADAEGIEAAGCFNKLPRDIAPCEEGWARSRRAVFSVTAGAETLKDAPAATSPAPAPSGSGLSPSRAEAPPRRSYLGGHAGLAQSTPAPAQGYAFLGPDLGLWLSPRWSLGLSADLALAPDNPALGRALVWLEAHSSSGPGAELWLGAGLGAGTIPPTTSSSPAAVFALRLGIDWHTSPATRLGPFLEVASRAENAGWIGLGVRMAHDFF
jgi:outer membrane protein OmpA-like peptidoglycan-associated protein